ncbi:MAG: hypothetical protein IKP86_03460 [Anaerolineaceae bacterium]|nr:hypothetical protein [Anaerolineaceae bacterium]
MKKHIVCYGDSNTHGACRDPQDSADHGNRFNEDERWTCLLQKKLGGDYLVLEEGLSGRTTAFDDPLHEGLSGVMHVTPILMSHDPVDLMIVMLGTNDTKGYFSALPLNIATGMERLVRKAQSTLCWGNHPPRILIVCPPWIKEGLYDDPAGQKMGPGCPEKSRELAKYYREVADLTGCFFMDAEGIAEFNDLDCMHLTAKGHRQLADALAEKVTEIFASVC